MAKNERLLSKLKRYVDRPNNIRRPGVGNSMDCDDDGNRCNFING